MADFVFECETPPEQPESCWDSRDGVEKWTRILGQRMEASSVNDQTNRASNALFEAISEICLTSNFKGLQLPAQLQPETAATTPLPQSQAVC